MTRSSHPLHNFLFMLPASTSQVDQEVIMNLAQKLSSIGYVYVASARETAMTDRENIRFMPLRLEQLPSFGILTAVFVVKDQEIVSSARECYPEAHVLMLDPDRVAEDLPEYEPEQIIASWPASGMRWSKPVPEGVRFFSAA